MRLLPRNLIDDFWGGFAAMLVALPSAIAFGVTIYSPLGGAYAAYGALAGILGVTALGLVASTLGGTKRLITAPCAPAAAVLSAFAADFIRSGASPESTLFLLMAIAVLSGALQFTYGAVGIGRLIKYMPYPVVSGYMTGVGLIIIASQIPKFLGVTADLTLTQAVISLTAWKWQSIVVGLATAGVMLGAPKVTTRVPAAILALGAGVFTYFVLGLLDSSLLNVDGNPLIVGPMGGGDSGGSGGGFLDSFMDRIKAIRSFELSQLQSLLVPALTLSVLLSIDTLKTCIVLDAMTRSRHNSNRELIGQGVGNLASAFIGGIPGAGTMGPTLVNFTSGAASQFSGIIEGVLALITFVLLGNFIAWVPIASLAAILIVIGIRMIDRHALALCKSRHTIFDFFVILAVVIVALFVGLIPASGTGIVLAILLFIREQLKGSILRRKISGSETFSRRRRPNEEREILQERGEQTVILELQGSLFFGTADQLYSVLEPEIKTRKYIVLDMQRVQTIDFTAAHVLEQTRDAMAEKNGFLVYSRLPMRLPSGKNLGQYIDETGMAPYKSAARVFDDLDEAKGWIENRTLKEAAGILKRTRVKDDEEKPLELDELEIFKGRKKETLDALAAHLVKTSYPAGTRIFACGDPGTDLYFVRKGLVRLMLPIGGSRLRRIDLCGRGSFFGELAFMDGDKHSTDAVAETDVELFALSRNNLDTFADQHKKAARNLVEGLASILTKRVRFLTNELISLES
ncbi:MAG: SLC26A/SulP transporter family protein [Rhodobacteraceae bacterium]|nr:SLC26A/SulP transporter family protein [Paracoccaceae bacterium]